MTSAMHVDKEKVPMTSLVHVYTEFTPNPDTVKFIVNKLLINGSVDFPDREKAQQSRFASELFRFSFVEGAFFANNFVTITKSESVDWDDVIPPLTECIRLAVESDYVIAQSHEEKVGFEGTEIEKKIQEILYEYVKPAVEGDGGAISFKSFDEKEGLVILTLKGACSGCPSSIITLKMHIENLLKRMIPEVSRVEAEAV